MAQKRMFSKRIVDTDKFLDMSIGAQALYFHLGLHADDDGFVASPKKIINACGCKVGDLHQLVDNGYIILLQSGVCFIPDWLVNNTLKGDRYTPTLYATEKTALLAENSEWFRNGSKMVPQLREDKNRLELVESESKGELALSDFEKSNIDIPTLDILREHCRERKSCVDPNTFFYYYEARGWKIDGKPIEGWKSLWNVWEERERDKTPYQPKLLKSREFQGTETNEYGDEVYMWSKPVYEFEPYN